MIDTHAHLDFENFDEDREEVIRRAFDNGVKKIINIGVDLETSRKSVEIAEKYDRVFASAGIHPDFFAKGDWGNPPYRRASWVDELKKLAKHKKVVAIGECGLDYFRVREIGGIREIRERQKKGFLAQIELARELNLPVVVHCREAWSDLYDIISKFKIQNSKFILHCYSGEKTDTEKFVELPNILFSFSGNITYPKPISRSEKLAEAVRMIPLGRIMLDSDSPFLAPQAMRGKRNEPMFVKFIAQKIAEIKEISVEDAERKTDENAVKFFGIE